MNILSALLAFFYALLPFQFALNVTDGFDVAISRIIAIIIILFFIAHSLFTKKFHVAYGWISGFLLFFFTWTFLSLFYSPVPMWTLRKVLFLCSFFPLFYVIRSLFFHKENSRTFLIHAWIYGACAISLVGIMQFSLQFFTSLSFILNLWTQITPFFLGNELSSSVITYNSWLVNIGARDIMRSIAIFPDPHIFAFYCGLSLPMSIALFVKERKKIWLWCSVAIFVADLLSFSRGGYVGLLGGFMIFILLSWHALTPRMRNGLYTVLFFIFCTFFIPQNIVTQRFFSSFDPQDTSNTHRITLWSDAVAHIAERPFFGTGLGAYAYIVEPTTTYRTPIYAHNIYLDIAAEIGLIGLLVFILLCGRVLYVLYMNRADIIAFFAIISLSTFLFHGIFDTPIFSVHILPALILIFAIAASYEHIDHKNI